MTRERGFALITVVLLMIGLAVLATGLLFAASQQAAVADSMTDLVRARHGAETAVGIAVADWNAAQRALDPAGEPVVVVPPFTLDPGIDAAATAARIAPGTFLVTGSAAVRRGRLPPIRRTAVRVVHSLDLDELGLAMDAAVIVGHGSLGAGASVGGVGASAAIHPDAAELCARWPPLGAGARAPAGGLTIAGGAQLSGSPAVLADPDAGALADSIARLGLGEPEPPVVDAVIGAADSVLAIGGGTGQGVLVVPGDLVLEGGHAFRGLVVVLGTATLRDASISGALVAARVDLEVGTVTLDRCAIADALVSSAAARAAYPPARSWLPTFD
jgi:hypothetical protein